MWTIGQPLAVLPKSSPASLKPSAPGVVVRAAEEFELGDLEPTPPGRSSLSGRAARLDLEAVEALAEVAAARRSPCR